MRALVRRVASTFADAITTQTTPIVQAQAVQQHGAYTQVLQRCLGPQNVTVLPADDNHPDCCFIEDTAVVVGDTAIVAHLGAGPRQGEEGPVAAALQGLGYSKLVRIQPPATLDGGDVLQLPGSTTILVGLSRRTNAAALDQLRAALPHHTLHGVAVEHGLHLKCAVTALDAATLLFADDEAGRALHALLREHPACSTAGASGGASGSGSGGAWQHVMVDPVHANVVLVGQRDVVVQPGPPGSSQVLRALAEARGLQLHEVPFDAFAAADGSLTCCSIFLPPLPQRRAVEG